MGMHPIRAALAAGGADQMAISHFKIQAKEQGPTISVFDAFRSLQEHADPRGMRGNACVFAPSSSTRPPT